MNFSFQTSSEPSGPKEIVVETQESMDQTPDNNLSESTGGGNTKGEPGNALSENDQEVSVVEGNVNTIESSDNDSNSDDDDDEKVKVKSEEESVLIRVSIVYSYGVR